MHVSHVASRHIRGVTKTESVTTFGEVMRPMDMTIDEFAETLRGLTSFEWPAELDPYDDLETVAGFDSLHIVEIALAVENLTEAEPLPENVPPLNRIADAYDYYWACLGHGHP